MERIVLKVEGMSCEHCVKAIKRCLSEFDGIGEVEVNLNEKKVNIEYDKNKVTLEEIKNIIDEEGYEVV